MTIDFDAFYFIAWLVYEQVAIAALDMGDDALALVRSAAGSHCSSDQGFVLTGYHGSVNGSEI